MSEMTAFPESTFALGAHHIALWAEAMGCDPKLGVTPSIALLICFRGSGVSIDDIMDVLETEPENVLFGEIDIELHDSIRPERSYAITTHITDIERKHGRSIGAFDKVTLRYTIYAGGRRAATVTQIWMVSREEA